MSYTEGKEKSEICLNFDTQNCPCHNLRNVIEALLNLSLSPYYFFHYITVHYKSANTI